MARPALIDLGKLPKRPRAGKVLVPWDVLQRLVAVHNAVVGMRVEGGTFDISDAASLLRIGTPISRLCPTGGGPEALSGALERPSAGKVYPLDFAWRPMRAMRLTCCCQTGAAQVELRINNTTVLSASVGVTRVVLDISHGGLAPGDSLALAVSEVTGAEMLSFALEYSTP